MANKILLLLPIALLLSSCKSVNEHLKENTIEILEAVKDNDIDEFNKQMDPYFLEKYPQTIRRNFELANNYIDKYKEGTDIQEFEISYSYSSPPFMQAVIPLFNGFDSTSGVKSAKLILDFRPKSQSSKDCILVGISVNEDVDLNYWRYLLDNKLIPNELDSLIQPMDSTIEKERKKIEVF